MHDGIQEKFDQIKQDVERNPIYIHQQGLSVDISQHL